MNQRALLLVFAALVLAAPGALARTSAADLAALDVDECSIRRGPNEPPAHCGANGAGGRGSAPRAVAEVKPPVARSAVQATTWGQVKHALAAR